MISRYILNPHHERVFSAIIGVELHLGKCWGDECELQSCNPSFQPVQQSHVEYIDEKSLVEHMATVGRGHEAESHLSSSRIVSEDEAVIYTFLQTSLYLGTTLGRVVAAAP